MAGSLYINDVGQNRFDVVRLLAGEYQVGFADVKLILAGIRTKLMTAEIERLRKLQERLERMGASTVLEIHAAGVEESL